jgi:hypothetical protein
MQTRPKKATRTSVPTKLVLVLPFTNEDVTNILENARRWHAPGPPCSEGIHKRVDLWLLFNKLPRDLPAEMIACNQHPAFRGVQHCFGQMKVAFANLTRIEDEYPAGPSNMFFRMFFDANMQQRSSEYRTMFWMEGDVFPLKPYWIDKLYAESLVGDFWMKGSIYFGHAFDDSVMSPETWNWVGHINGNALYRLHEPQFTTFLRAVSYQEPPNHFWKPFDVSIWKVLHDFPYSWHIHQRIIKYFVYNDFIQHWGFTVNAADIDRARHAPNTFLLHGKNTSAGIVKYKRKFDKINAAKVDWDGSIDTSDGVCICMCATMDRAPDLVRSIESVRNFMPKVSQIVVSVPDKDAVKIKDVLDSSVGASNALPVKFRRDPNVRRGDDNFERDYKLLTSDESCEDSAYVMYMPDMSIFTRKMYRKDVFFMGRPLFPYRFHTPAKLPRASPRRQYIIPYTNPPLIPRKALVALRKYVDAEFGASLHEFLKSRPDLRSDTAPFDDHPSALQLLGRFIWNNMHNSVWWVQMGAQDTDASSSYMTPIVPPFAKKL